MGKSAKKDEMRMPIVYLTSVCFIFGGEKGYEGYAGVKGEVTK